MKRGVVALFIQAIFIASTFAAEPDLSHYFENKKACFILYNYSTNKIDKQYNNGRCEEQLAPYSIFDIPLSLMAFDQRLITQETLFKWDGKTRIPLSSNKDQTPGTWLYNSVSWISEQLRAQLGTDKIKFYLQKFNYGNQDPADLKISPNEQLAFLKSFLSEKLGVSQEAAKATLANLYLDTTNKDWKIFGTSGGGYTMLNDSYVPEGWFVGFLEKEKQIYIFVLQSMELVSPKRLTRASSITQDTAKTVFDALGF